MILAKDKDDNTISYTSSDSDEYMIKQAQAAILKEMNISTIGRVFLLRKAPRFFGRVIDYINKEYDNNWTHYKSQIEVTIVSRSQLQKCYDEYIAKHNDTEVSLQECRERIKARLTKMVDSEVRRAEKKYNDVCATTKSELQQKLDNSTEMQDLMDCGVFTENYIDNKVDKYDDKVIDTIKEYSEFIRMCCEVINPDVDIAKHIVFGVSIDKYHNNRYIAESNLNKYKKALQGYAQVVKVAQGNTPRKEGNGIQLIDGLCDLGFEEAINKRIEILDKDHKPHCPQYKTYRLIKPEQIKICCDLYLSAKGDLLILPLGLHEYRYVDYDNFHICNVNQWV